MRILSAFTLFLLCLGTTAGFSQTTVVFQPGPLDGMDISYGNNPNYLVPDSNSTDFGATQWTCGGSPCELRTLFRFELSSIPANAVVVSAVLSLYANPQQMNGNPAAGPTYGNNNQGYLYPVTSPWVQSMLNWNTQPSITTVNSTLVPQSSSVYQDYPSLDVSAAVQNMISNPQQNYGWMIKMVTSNYYNCLIFCSSNFSDPTKRPKLTITYHLGNLNCTTLRPGPLNSKDISYGNLPAYLSPDSLSSDFGAVQWTCGGTPCEMRSLIQFDLSSIPVGITITSASLNLYANPQQLNGNIALGPMYGSANASNLYMVTSPWQLSTVNWNNEPFIDLNNPVYLPASTNNYQDYLGIDVTSVVQQWVTNPATNYGWLMEIMAPTYYNSMIFCSANFADSTKRPALEVCYVPLSVNENNIKPEFSISPNPASDYINITNLSGDSQSWSGEIRDQSGRIVESFNFSHTVGTVFRIDISQFAKGIYILSFQSGKKKQIQKFVKL